MIAHQKLNRFYDIDPNFIKVALCFSAISMLYGFALTLPPNQGMSYVVYDAFRKIAPLWFWGMYGILVSALHFVGFSLRRKWILYIALSLSLSFWLFVCACSLSQGWYIVGFWACLPHITVYARSIWRLGYWTQ